MSNPDTLAMLCEILEEIGHPCGDVSDPSQVALATLRIDSLSMLEILMAIDERTGVEVPLESIEQTMSLGELADLITRLSDG